MRTEDALAVVLGVAVVGGLLAAFRNLRHKRLLQDTPTSKVKAVYMVVARGRAQAFPASVVARPTSFRSGEYCEPAGFERSVSRVDLP
jgi:hypothetical protein